MVRFKFKYQILAISLVLLIVIVDNLIYLLPSLALVDGVIPSVQQAKTLDNTKLISQQSISVHKHEKLLKEAQILTVQGHEELAIGNAESALKIWQNAMNNYYQLGDRIGVIGSLINQSLALQSLGLLRRSCKTLVLAFQSDSQICEPSNQIENPTEKVNALIKTIQQQDEFLTFTGLQTLGDILRIMGNFSESEKVLQAIINNKEKYSNYDISSVFVIFGNTQRALYNRKKDLAIRSGNFNDAKNAISQAKSAFKAYQKVDETTIFKKITLAYNKLNSVQIQAKLNILSLLLDIENWKPQLKNRDELIKELQFYEKLIPYLVDELRNNISDFSNLTPIQEVHARLNFAKSLMKLKKINLPKFAVKQNTSQASSLDTELTLLALNEAKNANLKAQDLKNQRLKAYSLGSLGYIYEQANEFKSAKELTEKALIITNAIAAQDIAYQLEWQLARIYKNLTDIENAKRTYDVAIKTFDSVRQDFLALNRDAEFNFSEDVVPMYEEYLDLLLRSHAFQKKLANKDDANQEILKRATLVTASLQSAKVENFLRCVLGNLVPIEKATKPPAAIIYPIFIGERLEVIVIIPQPGEQYSEKLYHYTPKDFSMKVVNELRVRLQNKDDIKEFILPHAKKLYEWLIHPIENDLPKSGTLVFVLDSNLQSIPLAVLHDKKQYLIERYSIAISLGSQLPNSKSLSPGKWRALLAGISKKADSFKPENLPILGSVEDELYEIKRIVPHQIIENEQFRKDVLKSRINIASFPVVHIATHGEFSSDSEKTKIYAWDEIIKVNELNKLLQTRVETSSDPIELLVLSACKTAVGDKQAALGMAGVALKAEARSIIASLWQIDDGSTVEFMKQLYENLNKDSTTKAEAIQQVQKNLLKKDDYNHPYNWASFILVGNWL